MFFVKSDSFKVQGMYTGGWSRDKRDGTGVQTYKNGDKYDGSWREDKPEGFGTYWKSKPDSKRAKHPEMVKVYEGEHRNGVREGHGRLFLDSGAVYEGEFAGGLRHGRGRIQYGDGSVYVGEWANDLRHGQGTLTTPAGDSYNGSWSKDMKHGPGQYIYLQRGMVYTGEWIDDIAKCGEMTPLPLSYQRNAGRHPAAVAIDLSRVTEDRPAVYLQELGLADAAGVVSEAVEAARRAAEGGEGLAEQDVSQVELSSDSTAIAAAYSITSDNFGLHKDEVDQLGQAFRAGAEDSEGVGYAPANADVVARILANLGIEASPDDVHALLKELLANEHADVQTAPAPPGFIRFSTFAACMSRLRE